MAIFDYKGQDGRQLLSDAYALTAYTSASAATFRLSEIAGAVVPNIVQTGSPPPGWRNLAPSELGLSNNHLDITGSYMGEGPTFDGLLSSQAKVLGKFDANGNLTGLSFNIVATSFLTDIIDYIPMFDRSYIHAFDYLLNAIKDYAIAHGLSGEDIIITGYSEGAGVANGMYSHKDDSWGGFFSDSTYLGGASPVISDGEGIYNFGFENDIVHRIAGTSDNWVDGAIGALGDNDENYLSTTDNIVLFDDVYASPLWPYGPANILNPMGWVAHVEGALFNPIELIGNSTFYNYIERDSTIILSHLSDLTRPFTWVSDKATSTSDHFGTPAFLLGSQKADKLQDGRSDDLLDGFAGNDQFRLSTGTDAVAGGSGTDKVYVLGSASNYEAIRTSDGTLFLYDTTGTNGLKELTGVEEVVFSGAIHGFLDSGTYNVTSNRLDGFLWNDIAYSSALQGTAGNNTLTGGSGRDRMFGLDGNDQLRAGGGNDLVHGGNGADTLFGEAGNDALYGGVGNDTLNGGIGHDTLSGGVGSDRFVFTDTAFGRDVISDFDIHENGDDMLGFSSAVFSSVQAILNAAVQVGDDTIIRAGSNSVTLTGVDRADLFASDLYII